MPRPFAHFGARVFATGISADELAETAAEGGIATKVVDLRDRAAATAWIGQVETRTGGLVDVLVNNAGGVGGQRPVPLEEVSDEAWKMLFDVNVNAAFTLCPAAAPAMKRTGGGRIVNARFRRGAAVIADRHPGVLPAKPAVVGLARQLALEFGPYNITVNSVAPGFIPHQSSHRTAIGELRTRWTEGTGGADRDEAGTAQEIANAVVFFPSGLAGFVNGQILPVDGGR